MTNKPDRTGRGIRGISSLSHWCCLPHFVGSCYETEEILRIIPWAEGYLDSEIEQHGLLLGEDEWTALLFSELDSSLLKKHRCKGRIPPTTCTAGCDYEQSTTNAQDCNTAVCFWESKLDFYRVVNVGGELSSISAVLLMLMLLALAAGCVERPAEEPGPQSTPSPVWESTPIPAGEGRLALDLAYLPQQITIRQVKDEFLIGVGTTDNKAGCVSANFLNTLRAAGINYFLPFTSWAVIEPIEGYYLGGLCPYSAFYKRLSENGATLTGHCLLFFIDEPWTIPDFVAGRSFDEQKRMIETFVKTTVEKYPEIEIWDLNEPVAQNSLGWSLDQHYDIFVSASKWIHEARPEAKVMINMIPIPCHWSTFQYEPEPVMDELLARGLEADVIGVELYY